MNKRQSRYIRPNNKSLGRIEIHDRDVEILHLIFDYRFIRTDHITALIKGDRSSIEKRLRKLWEHKFIERSFLPVIPGKEPSTRRAIYSIDYKGATVLGKERGIDPSLLRLAIKRNRSDYKYIEHQLIISNFRVVLTIALRKENKAKILFWHQDNTIRDRVDVPKSSKKETLPIAPDSYFCIEDEKGKMYWFLEADRYTMDHRRFLNKMKAYYLWWENKGHTNKFGIKNFRVLTVCPNSITRDRRLEVTLDVKKSKNQKDISIGSRLFWFVSEQNYTLKEFSKILDDIFIVARKDDNNRHKILK